MTLARRRMELGALALVIVTLGGCVDVPAPSASPTLPPTPEPTPATVNYQPNTTVWYEGLLIHVDTVTATLDERGGPVELGLRLENPGEDDVDLNARVLIQVDADVASPPLAPTRDSKIPTAPAHGSVGAVLTYELQGIASVDKAVVLIGEAPNHVGRVPLTAAGGAPVVFEPVDLDLSGKADAGDLRITLRSGLLRWDLPDWSEEMGSDLEALTLTYDVTYLGTFTGGFAFTGDNVALRLADGKIVEARRDGHSQSIELVGSKSTKPGLFSRFEVPSGMTGKFALVVRNGSTSKTIPFTMPG